MRTNGSACTTLQKTYPRLIFYQKSAFCTEHTDVFLLPYYVTLKKATTSKELNISSAHIIRFLYLLLSALSKKVQKMQR